MKKWYLFDLKELAEHRFTTYVEIEEIGKVHRNTLNRIQKKGASQPRKGTLEKLSAFFKMKYDRDEVGVYFYEEQNGFDELVQQTGQMVKESEASYDGLPEEDRKAAENFIDLLKNGPEKEKKIITSVLEVLKGDSN